MKLSDALKPEDSAWLRKAATFLDSPEAYGSQAQRYMALQHLRRVDVALRKFVEEASSSKRAPLAEALAQTVRRAVALSVRKGGYVVDLDGLPDWYLRLPPVLPSEGRPRDRADLVAAEAAAEARIGRCAEQLKAGWPGDCVIQNVCSREEFERACERAGIDRKVALSAF